MTVTDVIRREFRHSSGSFSVVAALYVINLVFSSVIALAFRGFVTGIGNAASLGPLLKDFDMTLFYDFLRTHGDGVRALSQVTLFMTVCSLAVNAMTSGGILAALGEEGRGTLRVFFDGCVKFAARFLRLLLVTVIMTGIAAGVLIAASGAAIGAFTRGSTSEIPAIEGIAAAVLVCACAAVLLVMASDYARVFAALADSRSMVRALGSSFMFIGRNAWGTIALQGVLVLAGACLLAVYLLLSGLIEMDTGWQVFLVFLLQQAFVLCRTFLRVLTVACELTFARSRAY